jgi:autotransporter passenger strand-loop-strand repeat protein
VTGKAVNSGDELSVVSGGVAGDCTVTSGGVLYAISGGTVYDTEVTGNNNATANGVSGGVVYAYSGGIASGTKLNGGSQFISGGLAYGTNIYSGGVQQVAGTSGSTVYGTQIFYSGEQFVELGTASGTVISSGGEQSVGTFGLSAYGGIASGTNVLTGAFEDISNLSRRAGSPPMSLSPPAARWCCLGTPPPAPTSMTAIFPQLAMAKPKPAPIATAPKPSSRISPTACRPSKPYPAAALNTPTQVACCSPKSCKRATSNIILITIRMAA